MLIMKNHELVIPVMDNLQWDQMQRTVYIYVLDKVTELHLNFKIFSDMKHYFRILYFIKIIT